LRPLATIEAKRGNSAGVNREGFLKIDLTGVASIASARLRLFGRLVTADSHNIPVGVFSSSDTSWGESTLTWNRRPATGSTARATTTVTDDVDRWYEWDVSAYLRSQRAAGKTLVTLVLKTTTTSLPQALFYSDEAVSNRPQLVITP
jgi:hypothetical protein